MNALHDEEYRHAAPELATYPKASKEQLRRAERVRSSVAIGNIGGQIEDLLHRPSSQWCLSESVRNMLLEASACMDHAAALTLGGM